MKKLVFLSMLSLSFVCCGFVFAGNANQRQTCSKCLSTGEFEIQAKCLACKGKGVMVHDVKYTNECHRCNGTGRSKKNYQYPCNLCSGQGEITKVVKVSGSCEGCSGTGWHEKVEKCTACRGTGYTK